MPKDNSKPADSYSGLANWNSTESITGPSSHPYHSQKRRHNPFVPLCVLPGPGSAPYIGSAWRGPFLLFRCDYLFEVQVSRPRVSATSPSH